MFVLTRSAFLAGLALIAVGGAANANPDCKADTFSGEQSCIYGRGSIGLPGIGNQIITQDGRLIFRRLVSQIGGQPIDVDAILFRVDDRRTIMLPATNATRPAVNCGGSICTWSWTVDAPISPLVLEELGNATKLVIGFRGEGLTIQEQPLKRGGQIFSKFLADLRKHEPNIIVAAIAENFLMEGRLVRPYEPPEGIEAP